MQRSTLADVEKNKSKKRLVDCDMKITKNYVKILSSFTYKIVKLMLFL